MYIDTHCHLDLPPLAEQLHDVLCRAHQAGVHRYVVPGVAREGWRGIKALAEAGNGILPAYGIHPQLAHHADDTVLEELSEYLADGAVAVGEIGLDYQAQDVPREIQQEAFRRQLRLAVKLGLPVLIHCRAAFADLLQILRQEGGGSVGGLMHAFSGSPETARECIRLGYYISVCGTITYGNARRPPRVVREIPLERLVLETDAPDITPEPHRGRPNEPAYLAASAAVVAEIKGVSLAEVAAVTTANALRALHITGKYSRS
jgi:TatD DNase family protein